jgi:Tol biopolymer transport system component/DNA-binding winged helix-turn-helix (wHTH) protein
VPYEFDDLVVDPTAFRLSRRDRPVRIEPKALRVLIDLIEHRQRPVSKQELLERIWPDVSVTENALTRAIAQLRKTLGDDVEAPRYIETVPTRGYRFIGELRSERPNAPAAPPARPRRSVALILPPLFVLGSALMLAVLLRRLPMLIPIGIAGERFDPVRPGPPPIAARILHPSDRLQVAPSFSPDGASIVYSADVDGIPHLFIAPAAGGDERQLTNGEDGQAQPSWSPDGKHIAFTSIAKRGIWLVGAGGGEAERLTSFGSRPSWSSDGTEIAFQSGEDIEYGWTAYDALPASTIWIVDVRTGKTSPLTRKSDPPGGHGAPSWRRDGKRIVFSSCDHERCALYTIARDSSGLTRLVRDPRRLTSPVFAPDGATVYAVHARYNESTLFEISIGPDGEPLSDMKRLRQSNPGVIQHLALSRDGFRFAWSVVEEKNDIFVTVGEQSKQLTNNPAVNATFPSFSRDGNRIAYCAVAAGDDSGIWIADADGTNAKALITGAGLKQYARWGRGNWDVAAELPEDGSAPAISPDLKMVAFNRTIEGKTSVWTSNVDGSSLQRMTDDADLARFPVWSPDGKRLAVQLRGDGSSIALLPGKRILVRGDETWPHSWSPDGKQIAYAARREGVWNVWTVDAASGVQTQVTRFSSMTGWVRTPAFAPDGKRIIFEGGHPRGNVWISEPRVAQ